MKIIYVIILSTLTIFIISATITASGNPPQFESYIEGDENNTIYMYRIEYKNVTLTTPRHTECYYDGSEMRTCIHNFTLINNRSDFRLTYDRIRNLMKLQHPQRTNLGEAFLITKLGKIKFKNVENYLDNNEITIRENKSYDFAIELEYPINSHDEWNLTLNHPDGTDMLIDPEIDACTTFTTSNVTYTLNASISNSATTNCFDFDADNVTLDCQGFTVDSNLAADSAVRVDATYDNNLVKNCRFTDWDTQTILAAASNFTLENIWIDNSRDVGISNNGGGHNYTNITVINSLDEGMIIRTGSSAAYPVSYITDSVIANNTRQDIEWVDDVDICHKNIYTNVKGTDDRYIMFINETINMVDWNNVSDMILCKAHNSNITNLTIAIEDDNDINYIFVQSSDNVTFTNINLSNMQYGLYVRQSDNLKVDGATIYDIGVNGIWANNMDSWNISNVDVTGAAAGIYLYDNCDNGHMYNVTAYSNTYGVWNRQGSNDNLLENLNLSDNTYGMAWGTHTGSTSRWTIRDSIMKDNSYWDLRYDNHVTCAFEYDNVTGTGDKPLYFFNDTVNLNNWNNNYSGIILCGAHNSNITNMTKTGSNNALIIVASDNVTLDNYNMTDGYYSLLLDYADDVLINNSVFDSPYDYGIYAPNSRWGEIYNSRISNCPDDALHLVYLAHNWIIKDNNFTSNLDYDINVNGPDNINITGNRFDKGADTTDSIRLSATTGTYVWNNFFNATNYLNTGTTTYYYNRSKTAGTNIMGGANLGGNYWAKPNGNGHSENSTLCNDSDSDGICDNNYSIDGIGGYAIDYLPLSNVTAAPTPPTDCWTEDTTNKRIIIPHDCYYVTSTRGII